jgi:hypothetical protein
MEAIPAVAAAMAGSPQVEPQNTVNTPLRVGGMRPCGTAGPRRAIRPATWRRRRPAGTRNAFSASCRRLGRQRAIDPIRIPRN